MTAADSGKITIPRPKPHQAVIAITDADGASAWVTVSKSDLGDPGLLARVTPILEDGQRQVHEQRAAATARGSDGRRTDGRRPIDTSTRTTTDH